MKTLYSLLSIINEIGSEDKEEKTWSIRWSQKWNVQAIQEDER